MPGGHLERVKWEVPQVNRPGEIEVLGRVEDGHNGQPLTTALSLNVAIVREAFVVVPHSREGQTDECSIGRPVRGYKQKLVHNLNRDILSKLTSRSKNPLSRSHAISPGIGSVLFTFSALFHAIISTKNNSTSAWTPAPMTIFAMAHPAIFHLLLSGNALAPCIFHPSDILGKRPSKSNEMSDGSQKNNKRTASVPRISILSGDCVIKRVDHVM